MANEYNIISDEALDTLCGVIKGIANAGEIVDDTGVAMDKTYSSFKIQEELDKKIEGDNVVKKDDIVAVLDDTVTDEQVPSGKAVVDELGLKANASEVVKKTDIATVLDDTVTDEQVPSAKVVYDKISSIMSASPTSYSLDEQLTGGTWVDGKPIYRKTINFGALTNAVEKRVSHGITNIDTVVNYYGTTSSNSKATMLLPHVSNSDVYSIAISLDATSLIVVPGTDRTMYTKTYITVEYTKTTD